MKKGKGLRPWKKVIVWGKRPLCGKKNRGSVSIGRQARNSLQWGWKRGKNVEVLPSLRKGSSHVWRVTTPVERGGNPGKSSGEVSGRGGDQGWKNYLIDTQKKRKNKGRFLRKKPEEF